MSRDGLPRQDLVLATRMAALVSGLVALTALLVRIAAAERAREWLDFTFTGLDGFEDVLSIFLTNAQLLAAVLVACVVVRLVAPRDYESGLERGVGRGITLVCDCVLVAGCLFHVLFVGTALGAYGGRTLEAMLPHAPIELAAFTLALALYVTARTERLAQRNFVAVAVWAVAAMAAAALVEVVTH